MRSLLTWWEAFWVKKKKALPQPPSYSPLLRLRLTCCRYMGIKDNRLPFTGKVAWHDKIFSLCIRQDAIFCLTITEAFPLKGTACLSTLRIEMYSSVSVKIFEVWQKSVKTCIELWMAPWCHSVPRWEGIWRKAGTGTLLFITRLKGQRCIIVRKKSLLKTGQVWVLEFFQVIDLWQHHAHTHTHLWLSSWLRVWPLRCYP